jgi:hypothetical protein
MLTSMSDPSRVSGTVAQTFLSVYVMPLAVAQTFLSVYVMPLAVAQTFLSVYVTVFLSVV